MPKYKDKSKAYVINKLADLVETGKLEETVLQQQISECLYERDYNTIADELKEYRRGEIDKLLENETDAEKRIELMMQKDLAKKNLKVRRRSRRR